MSGGLYYPAGWRGTLALTIPVSCSSSRPVSTAAHRCSRERALLSRIRSNPQCLALGIRVWDYRLGAHARAFHLLLKPEPADSTSLILQQLQPRTGFSILNRLREPALPLARQDALTLSPAGNRSQARRFPTPYSRFLTPYRCWWFCPWDDASILRMDRPRKAGSESSRTVLKNRRPKVTSGHPGLRQPANPGCHNLYHFGYILEERWKTRRH